MQRRRPRQAPPVVAVVVVHEPEPWFDDTLESFARQDYPNLRLLFLGRHRMEPSIGTGRRRRRSRSPRSSRASPLACPRRSSDRPTGNPGFGAVANEVLRLVEGEHGLFLVCHDDVAIGPRRPAAHGRGAVPIERRRGRAEARRLGRPAVLQSVGMGVDRFGEIDHSIELGEVDQEQHDGVRDVFAVPSACMLIRADLFRELDGFDESLSFHGEDVELCWRIHHSGARVVVAPSARVRHRERTAAAPARPAPRPARGTASDAGGRDADGRGPPARPLGRDGVADDRRTRRRRVHRHLRAGVGIAAGTCRPRSRARRRCSRADER